MYKFILILFGSSLLLAGTKNKPLFEINQQHKEFASDKFQNVYLVDGDKLFKYDSTGTLYKTYNSKLLGNISHLDVNNPMRPLIFYADFFKVLYLDNTLTQNGPIIDLLSLGFSQPKLVCTSSNNSLWVFDQLTQELVRLDSKLEILNRSGNLTQLLGKNITPHYLLEQNNKVFLADSSLGIMNFDIFGNYLNTLPQKAKYPFQVINENIVYLWEDKLIQYNTFTFETDTFSLETYNPFNGIWFSNNKLLISNTEKVSVFENTMNKALNSK